MNTIDLMLEALMHVQDYLIGSRQCAPLLNAVTAAIEAGEAELKREPVARICKPHGLMFDAMGDPRTRYVRVTLNGSHCVMSPTEGDNYVQDAKESGDDSDYIVTDVYLSEREFDDLPEHDGF